MAATDMSREAERYPIRVIRAAGEGGYVGSHEGLRGAGVGCRLPGRARMLRGREFRCIRCGGTACELDDSACCPRSGNGAASCVMADSGSKGQGWTACP